MQTNVSLKYEIFFFNMAEGKHENNVNLSIFLWMITLSQKTHGINFLNDSLVYYNTQKETFMLNFKNAA